MRRKIIYFISFTALMLIFSITKYAYISGNILQQNTVIWFFDVGQGDGIFIDTPWQDVIIDGGKSQVMTEKVNSVLPFWDWTIDIAINTHLHADHVIGLMSVLDRYVVEQVFYSGVEYESNAANTFIDFYDPRTVQAGDKLELAEGVTMEILWPNIDYTDLYLDDINESSVVLLFNIYGKKVLLTGDAGVEVEEMIADKVGDIDILKIGHHGSVTSTSEEFLEKIDPEFGIISVGENNGYGHPHDVVLKRLIEDDIEILRTDSDGDIRILIDEQGMINIEIFNL